MNEMCCTRLAGNTGRKKSPKIATWAPSHNFFPAVSLQLIHAPTTGKLVKEQYLPTGFHNMVNFGPLTAEICWRVWDNPANFNRFRVLVSLLH